MNPQSVTAGAVLIVIVSVIIGLGVEESVESFRVSVIVGLGLSIALVLVVALRGLLKSTPRDKPNQDS